MSQSSKRLLTPGCMNQSRVSLYAHSSKTYNVMKINPPIDIKIQSWIKPKLYLKNTSMSSKDDHKTSNWKKRKGFTSVYRQNKYLPSLVLAETSTIGKSKNKFIGRRESFNQNSNYYILGKNDRGYEAFPVFDWFNFSKGINFRFLNEDEAEEKFKSRNKTLNLSLIMKDLKPMIDDESLNLSPVRKFRELDNLDSETSQENEDTDPTKYKILRSKYRGERSDSEAKDELGEGEFESKELEYFSDTPNSSSNERGFIQKSITFATDIHFNESDPEDAMTALPRGLSENNMFPSSSTSSDEDLSIQGRSIKALIEHSDKVHSINDDYLNSSSDGLSDNLDKSSAQSIRCPTIQQNISQTNFARSHQKIQNKKNIGINSITNPGKRNKKNELLLIEKEVTKYLARGPMNSKTLVKKLKKRLPEMHPEEFLKNISEIMKSCNVEKQQTKDGKVIFLLK